MSVEHISRLNGVVKAHLKAIAVGQPHGFCLSPSIVPQTDQKGQLTGDITTGWLLMVSVPHPRPLLGQPKVEIASSYPVQGILPPDEMFTVVASRLYENVMAEVDKIHKTPAAVGMDLGALQS